MSIDKKSIFGKKTPLFVVGIPRNVSYIDSKNNTKLLTFLSRCTSFSLEELLEYSPYLFNTKYSIKNDIIYKDLYFNNILISSKELGSIEHLRQIEPNSFREEIRTIKKFNQTCCYTYYHDLMIGAKQV